METILLRLLILFLTAAITWAAPQRIVSTAPSITETLFAMGLGPRVVGVTNYCAYPPEVLKLPKIGTYSKPDVETIVALHPDLVVVQKQNNRLGEQLALLHVPYVEVQSQNLDAVYEGALAIGKAADDTSGAEHLVTMMKSELRQISSAAAGSKQKPTAVFLVGHTPGRLEGLFAGAGGSYFSDLLTAAGAVNTFADSVAPYPRVSLEEILSRDPDYILEMSGDSKPKQEEVVALWQTRTTLRAVKNHHVFAIPSSPFVVPGPRAPEAARILLHLIHPELQLPAEPKQ